MRDFTLKFTDAGQWQLEAYQHNHWIVVGTFCNDLSFDGAVTVAISLKQMLLYPAPGWENSQIIVDVPEWAQKKR